MAESLTAAERETVVLADDASDTIKVTTFQRRVITKLNKNPNARLIEDVTIGRSVGAIYELPAWCLSFRQKRQTGRSGNPDAFRDLHERDRTLSVSSDSDGSTG